MNKKGFSLVEIMVSLPLVLLILASVWGTYITMQKLFPGGIIQVAVQSYGRSGLGKISNNIRIATSTNVDVTGEILTIVLDPNGTYSDVSDDITVQYSISGTNLMFDSDITVNGNSIILLENVTAETGIPYFQKNTDRIVVTFKVITTNVILGTQRASMTTTIKMRSNGE